MVQEDISLDFLFEGIQFGIAEQYIDFNASDAAQIALDACDAVHAPLFLLELAIEQTNKNRELALKLANASMNSRQSINDIAIVKYEASLASSTPPIFPIENVDYHRSSLWAIGCYVRAALLEQSEIGKTKKHAGFAMGILNQILSPDHEEGELIPHECRVRAYLAASALHLKLTHVNGRSAERAFSGIAEMAHNHTIRLSDRNCKLYQDAQKVETKYNKPGLFNLDVMFS
jgi:hypothetical protein